MMNTGIAVTRYPTDGLIIDPPADVFWRSVSGESERFEDLLRQY